MHDSTMKLTTNDISIKRDRKIDYEADRRNTTEE